MGMFNDKITLNYWVYGLVLFPKGLSLQNLWVYLDKNLAQKGSTLQSSRLSSKVSNKRFAVRLKLYGWQNPAVALQSYNSEL